MKTLVLLSLFVTSVGFANKHYICPNETVLKTCYLLPALDEELIYSKTGKIYRLSYFHQKKETVKVWLSVDGELKSEEVERVRNEFEEFSSENKYPIIEEATVFIKNLKLQACP